MKWERCGESGLGPKFLSWLEGSRRELVRQLELQLRGQAIVAPREKGIPTHFDQGYEHGVRMNLTKTAISVRFSCCAAVNEEC